MNRLLILVLVLLFLAGAAMAFYITADKSQPPVPPPVQAPVPAGGQPVQPEKPAAVREDKEQADTEPREQTVRVKLEQNKPVEKQAPPDTSFSLKKANPREIVPGVILQNKELTIQLEEANESLHIRRGSNDQVQMLWKQKF